MFIALVGQGAHERKQGLYMLSVHGLALRQQVVADVFGADRGLPGAVGFWVGLGIDQVGVVERQHGFQLVEYAVVHVWGRHRDITQAWDFKFASLLFMLFRT